MASGGNHQLFDESVVALLRRSELYQPAPEFVERLALFQLSEDRANSLLLDMCGLAREKMSGRGANRRVLEGWLRKVAETLDVLQLRSVPWIEHNVFRLGRHPRAGPKRAVSTACYRDIRLSSNPNLERRTEDVAATGNPETCYDDSLDLLGEDPLVDIDLPEPSVVEPAPVSEGRTDARRKATPSPKRPKSSQSLEPCRVLAKGGPCVRGEPIPSTRVKPGAADRPSRSTRRPSPLRRSPRRRVRSPSPPVVRTRRTSPRKRPNCLSVGPAPKRVALGKGPVPTRKVSCTESTAVGIVVEVSGGSQVRDRVVRSRRACWVPGCTTDMTYAKVHAYKYHVPGIFDERLLATSPLVLEGRKQALLQAAVWLLRRPVDQISDLVQYVQMQHLLTTIEGVLSISDCQTVAMKALCGYLGKPCPDKFSLDPVNSVAALVHWKAILLIAARISPAEREYWMTLYPVPKEVGLQLPRAFDTHFHLDRTLQAMGLRLDSTFQSVLRGTRVETGKEVVIAGTCASFCDPETYPTMGRLATLPDDMEVAVGVHPKKRFTHSELERVVSRLENLVKSPRVTAVGEIGLDHSVSMDRWPEQVTVLERILTLVELRHVLVLHCRGMSGDNGTEAYLLLLHFVKKAVSSDQRVYLHCFNGDSYVRDQWSNAFPNLYFGFTRMAAGFHPDQIKALKGINSERLLLETDAPYFNRPGTRWSAPNQLYWTAEAVAAYLKFTPGALLNATVTNACRLFRR